MRSNRLAAIGLAGTLLAATLAVGAPVVAQSPTPSPARRPSRARPSSTSPSSATWVSTSWSSSTQTEHPDIFINFIQAGYQEHHDQLLAQLAAGDVPDIAAIEVGFMSKFKAQPENFKNLLDYGAADIQKDYLPWRWEQATSADGSSVIGIPTDVGGMAMCYRTDLFAAAGLPTDPTEVGALWPDWESFIATGQKYVTGSGGKKFIDQATRHHLQPGRPTGDRGVLQGRRSEHHRLRHQPAGQEGLRPGRGRFGRRYLRQHRRSSRHPGMRP